MPRQRAARRSPSKLTDLTPDPANARRHTERNMAMIVDSLKTVGAARSIVIDEHGRVLAGNATKQAAAEAGITKVLTVDADGKTLVAVRRTGLTDAEKTQLAIADNRAGEFAGWIPEAVLAAVDAEIDLSAYFEPDELAVLRGAPPTDAEWMSALEGRQHPDDLGMRILSFSVPTAVAVRAVRVLKLYDADKNKAFAKVIRACARTAPEPSNDKGKGKRTGKGNRSSSSGRARGRSRVKSA